VGKDKLRRFAENETFANLFQPEFDTVFNSDFEQKGKWHDQVFNNKKPIVLELGCGRGEYTIGMGTSNPEKNYIGIDIKGARLWRGAKTAIECNMQHIAFIRTKIEFLKSFFGADEISEIWITFPDPQLKPRRAKKRLTSARFLNLYKTMLTQSGTINLKTDSFELYTYTKALLAQNSIKPAVSTNDLYNSEYAVGILQIRTHYESMFLEKGKKINYLKFCLPEDRTIEELPFDLIQELSQSALVEM